jgi:hypothetical protein
MPSTAILTFIIAIVSHWSPFFREKSHKVCHHSGKHSVTSSTTNPLLGHSAPARPLHLQSCAWGGLSSNSHMGCFLSVSFHSGLHLHANTSKGYCLAQPKCQPSSLCPLPFLISIYFSHLKFTSSSVFPHCNVNHKTRDFLCC